MPPFLTLVTFSKVHGDFSGSEDDSPLASTEGCVCSSTDLLLCRLDVTADLKQVLLFFDCRISSVLPKSALLLCCVIMNVVGLKALDDNRCINARTIMMNSFIFGEYVKRMKGFTIADMKTS